jgi:hypothetical protein
MRLRELTGYKKDPIYNILQNSTSAEELQDNLEANGFKEYVVGIGLYSSVLSRPDLSYVVKIFTNDTGYEKYLSYIIKYQNNPHVPKIRGKVLKVGSRFKVVRLEKLRPYIMGITKDDRYYDAIRKYIYTNKSNLDVIKKNIPLIVPLLNDIIQYSGYDLHDGNIMFRGDVPVITDPLSSLVSV